MTTYWVVKMPNYIVEEWKKESAGSLVGHMVVGPSKTGGSGKPELKLEIATNNPELPTEAIINRNEVPGQMIVFKNESGRDKTRLLGKVSKLVDIRFNATDQKYKQLLRKRQRDEANMKEKMRTQLDQGAVPNKKTARLKIVPSKQAAQPPINRAKDRRVRMDEALLQNLLLQQFDVKSHYNFKELQDAVNQPETYLKEVLGKICVYHQSGENRHTYSLKDEYQDAAEAYNNAQAAAGFQ
mmetsp:Transcript_21143/g.41938  ORF Transcript_21143/g.41938 Transcript_21143/m.41938 type:complete len:240 (-) Transcript_21143:115-834(-)|eukprot:CAMPEP_0175120138 /NCGR_PEP_ID=MMETSP0087-20121206/454_1 /TAXON_ID=136419 /ORGANISM="Unknown Unknown, Strain D1" /LENGTH=239 /DNA_ID=CAMNT_0016401551 /DNA_START=10 /DNA_END=729 /DNA_ORIENTATION=-